MWKTRGFPTKVIYTCWVHMELDMFTRVTIATHEAKKTTEIDCDDFEKAKIRAEVVKVSCSPGVPLPSHWTGSVLKPLVTNGELGSPILGKQITYLSMSH